MRVRTAVRRICEYCYIVRRKKRIYVYCTANVRHKQRTPFTTSSASCPSCGSPSPAGSMQTAFVYSGDARQAMWIRARGAIGLGSAWGVARSIGPASTR